MNPEFKVDVPKEVIYTLSKDKHELGGVELISFDDIINNLKHYWRNKQKIEKQPEVK